MSGIVKEIGHRKVYDILQSRKPRARMLTYGFFGFRLLNRRVGQPAADVLASAVLTTGRGVRRGYRALPCGGRDTALAASVDRMSVIIAGSVQAARLNEGEPCRVMARWSRLG